MAGAEVVLHPDAIVEAQAARLWYEARSPAAGLAFVKELDQAIESISSTPERWPGFKMGTRRYPLHRFPFFVVYRVERVGVVVIAVAHARRKPGYWRARVE